MLDKTFNPKEVEGHIYAQWEASGAFRAGRRPKAPAFCIVIPPPNVTGNLHIGHALNNTLQDALARFERMRGKDVLWQPGTDHAGIATQLVVERRLAERQMNRNRMGREAFVAEVWKWKEESGGNITRQLRRLGASCDWSRERFTMDEGLSRAVTKVFVTLYKEGLIYKDKRLVNWDPRLQTAVSDLEVESIEMKGKLYYVKYPIEGEKDRFITVATTRPETMLADVAVAVHPKDKRYKSLVGKKVRLPLVGRLIPIIADEYSDPEKGTGAVKITPAHDFNDFEVRKRHPELQIINVLNPAAEIEIEENQGFWENTTFADRYGRPIDVMQHIGSLQEVDGEVRYVRYEIDDPLLEELRSLGGLDRFIARTKIVALLEKYGLVEKIEDIVHSVPHDEKTKTVVLEPYLTEQWYLNVQPLAEKAIAAVEKKKTKFSPEYWTNVYFNWMKNIQPWCISRQLWWGHQIPGWYGPEGKVFVEENEEQVIAAAKSYYKRPVKIMTKSEFELDVLMNSTIGDTDRKYKGSTIPICRDEDVLDTWFSSALWAFSTLGWPESTPELKRYYPTSVLVTSFDIIFFWVARMMMMGLHFMKDVPFRNVVIHTRVLDEKGLKMSKTKGNVVDPVDLIDEYGADALRFALALAAGGRDMRIGAGRVETARNFGTKLWNASRFCEMNECVRKREFSPEKCKQTVNRWIVGETARTAAEVTAALEAYRFNDAANAIYHFVWDVFCDWYVEFIKPVLNGADEAAKAETRDAAAWVLDRTLSLLHPFMPFITEELWARMAEHATPRKSMLIEHPWPDLAKLPQDQAAHEEMQWLIDLVSGVRSVRAEMNVPPGARIALTLKGANKKTESRLKRHRDVLMTLARLDSARLAKDIPEGSVQFVIGEAVAALPLGDVIDFAKERARLEKELQKAEDEIAHFDAKLSNKAFVSRAPEEVIEEQKEKRAEAAAIKARLEEALKRLRA